MSRSFINKIGLVVILVLLVQTLMAQEEQVLESKYGLRVGLDLFAPVNTFFDKDRKGFELVGDYRVSKKFYVAAELGFLENITEEDLIEFSTNGS